MVHGVNEEPISANSNEDSLLSMPEIAVLLMSKNYGEAKLHII